MSARLVLAPADAARVRTTAAAIAPDAAAAPPRRIRAPRNILLRIRRHGPSAPAPRLALAVKLTCRSLLFRWPQPAEAIELMLPGDYQQGGAWQAICWRPESDCNARPMIHSVRRGLKTSNIMGDSSAFRKTPSAAEAPAITAFLDTSEARV